MGPKSARSTAEYTGRSLGLAACCLALLACGASSEPAGGVDGGEAEGGSPTHVVNVEISGLDEHEGRMAYLVLRSTVIERPPVGTHETTVMGGRITATFPSAASDGDNHILTFYVDVDDSGSCGEGDYIRSWLIEDADGRDEELVTTVSPDSSGDTSLCPAFDDGP